MGNFSHWKIIDYFKCPENEFTQPKRSFNKIFIILEKLKLSCIAVHVLLSLSSENYNVLDEIIEKGELEKYMDLPI